MTFLSMCGKKIQALYFQIHKFAGNYLKVKEIHRQNRELTHSYQIFDRPKHTKIQFPVYWIRNFFEIFTFLVRLACAKVGRVDFEIPAMNNYSGKTMMNNLRITNQSAPGGIQIMYL